MCVYSIEKNISNVYCFRIFILSVFKLTEIYFLGDWVNTCGFFKHDVIFFNF